jgi:signal transduction histidine kinase
MWRVVAVYRVITMIYAAVLIIRDHDKYAHPAGGIAVLALIIFWTSVTVVAYSWPGGRQRWMIVADVVVTAALVYSTRWVDTPARIAHGYPTLPSFWAASPVLACAVASGPWAGITAALAISASDYAERPQLSLENPFSNIVLLLIAGGIGGYIVRLGVQAEQAVARVARKEAAIAERERLARDIHDSVLQVLTRVSSRGQALGGEAAELGRLAAEQESALRRLITGTEPGLAETAGLGGTAGQADATAGPAAADGLGLDSAAGQADATVGSATVGGLAAVGPAAVAGTATGAAPEQGAETDLAPATPDLTTGGTAAGRRPGRLSRPRRLERVGATGADANETGARQTAEAGVPADTGPLVDLRPVIERFGDPQVTVSCPAVAVPLPSAAAGALGGAVAAALDNVRQHAGAEARAWVLVEDTGATVRVSIRDDGTGFGDGRLAEAKSAGRLGVSHSIVGRLREVGGTAWVTSAPGQGTEVELAVPRTGPRGPRPHRGRSPDLA